MVSMIAAIIENKKKKKRRKVTDVLDIRLKYFDRYIN